MPCGVYLDPFKTKPYGGNGEVAFQTAIRIPARWLEGAEVTVELQPGALDLVRCWNAEPGRSSLTKAGCTPPPGRSADACTLRATGGGSADATVLSFILSPAAPGFEPDEVGCELRGVYHGHGPVTYNGEVCFSSPPPPPMVYTPCDDVSFEKFEDQLWSQAKGEINWQAQVRIAHWREGREVRLAFPPGSSFSLTNVKYATAMRDGESSQTLRLEEHGGSCGQRLGKYTAKGPPDGRGRRLVWQQHVASRGPAYEACVILIGLSDEPTSHRIPESLCSSGQQLPLSPPPPSPPVPTTPPPPPGTPPVLPEPPPSAPPAPPPWLPPLAPPPPPSMSPWPPPDRPPPSPLPPQSPPPPPQPLPPPFTPPSPPPMMPSFSVSTLPYYLQDESTRFPVLAILGCILAVCRVFGFVFKPKYWRPLLGLSPVAPREIHSASPDMVDQVRPRPRKSGHHRIIQDDSFGSVQLREFHVQQEEI